MTLCEVYFFFEHQATSDFLRTKQINMIFMESKLCAVRIQENSRISVDFEVQDTRRYGNDRDTHI